MLALFVSPLAFLPYEPPHPQNLGGIMLPFLITHRKIINKSCLFCHLELIHHLYCHHLTQTIIWFSLNYSRSLLTGSPASTFAQVQSVLHTTTSDRGPRACKQVMVDLVLATFIRPRIVGSDRTCRRVRNNLDFAMPVTSHHPSSWKGQQWMTLYKAHKRQLPSFGCMPLRDVAEWTAHIVTHSSGYGMRNRGRPGMNWVDLVGHDKAQKDVKNEDGNQWGLPATRKTSPLSRVMKPVKSSLHTARPWGVKNSHYLSPHTVCLVIIRGLSNRGEGYI